MRPLFSSFGTCVLLVATLLSTALVPGCVHKPADQGGGVDYCATVELDYAFATAALKPFSGVPKVASALDHAERVYEAFEKNCDAFRDGHLTPAEIGQLSADAFAVIADLLGLFHHEAVSRPGASRDRDLARMVQAAEDEEHRLRDELERLRKSRK